MKMGKLVLCALCGILAPSALKGATMATTDYVNSRIAAATNYTDNATNALWSAGVSPALAATNDFIRSTNGHAYATLRLHGDLQWNSGAYWNSGGFEEHDEQTGEWTTSFLPLAGREIHLDHTLTRFDDLWAATNALANYTDSALALAQADTASAIQDALNLYILNTNAQIVVSNETLKVWEMLDGTNALRYTGIGSASFASATNSLSSSLSSLSSLVSRKIESPAHWADFAASGSTNAQNTVMLDRGSVTFTDGTVTWTAQGGYYFLTGHATASGSSSQFRIGADADDWFGLEVTASYLADIDPNSINVGTATVTVGTAFDDAYLAEPPHVYFTESLGLDFVELEGGVSWAQSGNNYVATISGIAGVYPSGFFRLKAMHAGGAVMRSTVPILPEGYRVENAGVYVDTVQPDSVITIQSGGKTYKLFAEEVQ